MIQKHTPDAPGVGENCVPTMFAQIRMYCCDSEAYQIYTNVTKRNKMTKMIAKIISLMISQIRLATFLSYANKIYFGWGHMTYSAIKRGDNYLISYMKIKLIKMSFKKNKPILISNIFFFYF